MGLHGLEQGYLYLTFTFTSYSSGYPIGKIPVKLSDFVW
jgi:hypothetical protein